MFASSSRVVLIGALAIGLASPSFAACPSNTCACPRACEGRMVTATYSVADLILPAGGGRPQPNELMHIIASTVCPKTWSGQGGEGTQAYHPLTMSLIVRQSAEAHEQLRNVLAAMRRTMDVQVSLETRIIRVSSETVEALGLEGPQVSGAVACLDDAQMRILMERVQQDKWANTMQAPKMTVLNGQKANLELNDKKDCVVGIDTTLVGNRKTVRPRVQMVSSGVKIVALPTVSADRRFVKLRLGVELSRVDTPVPAARAIGTTPALAEYPPQPRMNGIQLENTVVIPDGKTALLSSWTVRREVRHEFGPPVLGQIPYINRLFKNVGYGVQTEKTIVLVTPRVIVTQEQEEKLAVAPREEADGEEASEPVVEKLPRPAEKTPTLFVKDKKFRLTYEVDNVGTSQVKQVEVWWTKDARCWERFSEDVKPTGKVLISVKDDGTYGFRLNARSGAGLAAPAPKAGDLPNTWVVVDTKAPAVKMEPVKVLANNGGEVVLQWSVTDDHLDSRPVLIRYAEKPEGPWVELTRGTSADSYRRPIKGLPALVYFRIDATDKSGNVGTAWTCDPIQIDLKVPVIRNVTGLPVP